MPDKFRVKITNGMFQDPWPRYFDNFYHYCRRIADEGHWLHITVMNHELQPLGGKLIQTQTQGWYLRWDREEYHTLFVLRWA